MRRRRSTGLPGREVVAFEGRSMGRLAAVILAAGKGTRMKSSIPKVLHPLAGRPMIHYPVELARRLGAERIVVVAGHGRDRLQEALRGEEITFVTQEPQLGTAHALGFAKGPLEDFEGQMLILCGDVPLLELETLRGLLAHHRRKRVPLTILVGILDNPTGYGRVIRDPRGHVLRVVEERDATRAQRRIREVNAGTYCAEPRFVFRAMERIGRDNAQGEFYLTDLVEILAPEGVATYRAGSPEEFMGINDRIDLAKAEEILQWRLRTRWMRDGVTLRDPGSVYLDLDVEIGRDTWLGPQVLLRGRTIIGACCEIGAGCIIEESVLEDGVVVRPCCVISGSRVASGATIGPFAHIRPGSDIGPEARVGNFVEVKKSTIGRGSKASHLTYLGDTEVGRGVNIGAGTITCNYDGFAKHRTVIEDEVFVGSDTQLVAPVRIGKGALVGAGSVITEDVPPEALAVARARQVNIPGKGRLRSRRRKK